MASGVSKQRDPGRALRGRLLEAVERALVGDWPAAHVIVQAHEEDAFAAWIHAVVHRMEGDLANARYWYRRCGRTLREGVPTDAELHEIRAELEGQWEVSLPDPHPHDLEELARLRPRPDIRLIATDMDGTLVDDAKEIHDELWPLIDELHARGIAFCPASGRQYHNLVREFGEAAADLVYIAESGAYVVAGDREISSDGLGLELAKRVAVAVRGIPEAGAILCGKRSAYVERRDPPFVEEVTRYYARLRVVEDLLEIADDDALKVAVYDFTSGEHNTAPRLAAFRSTQQVVVSGPHWVDVLSPTASKGRALGQVQAALGVSPDQTMAFGDFLNDLEMMDAATWSFAMANAHPLLRDRARFVAPANSANGVVRTIRTVLGLDRPVSGRGALPP